MNALPQATAAAQAHAAAIVRALRDALPPPPNYELEREVLAQAGRPRPLAGWVTTHEPEQRRYVTHGTVCDIPVTAPFVGGYDHVPSLTQAADDAIHRVCAITGEGYTDVVLHGRRRWIGPMG